MHPRFPDGARMSAWGDHFVPIDPNDLVRLRCCFHSSIRELGIYGVDAVVPKVCGGGRIEEITREHAGDDRPGQVLQESSGDFGREGGHVRWNE